MKKITLPKILTLFFCVQLLFVYRIIRYPEIIEKNYANTVYPVIGKTLRTLTGWIPFSVGDVLYTLAILYGIIFLIKQIRKIFKRQWEAIFNIFAVLSVVYFIFQLFWGLNYHRIPLHQFFDFKNDTYTTEELHDFSRRLISKINAIQYEITENDTLKVEIPYSKKTVYRKTTEGYAVLVKKYPRFDYRPPDIKNSLFSTPLTYMGFSGYFNPFTGEAQVNRLIPKIMFPVVSCHEQAHQLGIAAEGEANFIGYLAAVNNNDIYFRYSGYLSALRYTLSEIYQQDTTLYKAAVKRINTGILKNMEDIRNFWEKYQNPIEPFFKATLDSYLKANNQIHGIKSYNLMIALLIPYYAKEKF